jgi:hypothetical protein
MSRDETPIYHRSKTPSAVPEQPQPQPRPVQGASQPDVENPIGDDAPVVVDLPDGQKVILGSISPGTVIEIAAWRGTERPDSRTTRIVLGVANNPALEEGIPVNQSVKKSRPRKRAWIWVVVTVAVIGGAALALLLSPLKFVHPTAGVSLGFGSADSSVVLILPIDSLTEGQLVVATKGDDVLVGQVAGIDSGQVLLQTGTTFTQVAEKSVLGSVSVIVPFIGLAL